MTCLMAILDVLGVGKTSNQEMQYLLIEGKAEIKYPEYVFSKGIKFVSLFFPTLQLWQPLFWAQSSVLGAPPTGVRM